ncbi:MAG: hypothetical protein WCS89_02940 [Candidatus Paceibacterota bacterium]|jgi:hypothetical protein
MNHFHKFKFPIIVLAVTILAGSPLFTATPIANGAETPSSADSYTVLAPLPCVAGNGITCAGGDGSLQEKVDFKTYVQYAINLMIAISAVIAVVMIVWGGIEYMYNGSFQGKKEGLERAKNAIIGLVLVLCSFIILKTIDPRLVEIPTTLVPKIILKDYMTKDASQMLLDRIQNDSKEYNLKRNEVGKLLQDTKQEKATKQAEIDELNTQIGFYEYEGDTTNPEYTKLLAEKAKATNELNNSEIKYQKQLAQSALNGTLSGATSATTNPDYDTPDKIKQLNKELESAGKYRDLATSKLQKLGEFNHTEINDNANYTEAVITLMKADQITNSAQSVKGGSLNARLQSSDGSGPRSLQSVESAKASIQSEIDKAKTATENIKDPKLKADLQAKINSSEATLNAKFGGK